MSWQQQGERGAQWAVRAILWLALHGGRLPARLLLYPITLYFLVTGGKARRASRAYLSRLFQRQAHWHEVAAHLHCFAATILDRVYFLGGQFQRFDIRLHQPEAIARQQERGGGALLLSAHHGSFDALRALAVTGHDLPIKVLMYPQHNEFITGLLAGLNPALADTVIPLGGIDSLLRVRDSVAQGDLVGMLGDRVAESDKVVMCRFLGADVAFPAGPALLAATLQVPVYLVFALYRGGNRYDVHFECFSEPVQWPRSEREAQVQLWTQRYAQRLEHYVRSAPYNWFNFYDYWNDAA